MAAEQRLVLIDQDGSGPGGSNQMAMMVLLQSPEVRVLGITMVSGNAWEPEEVAAHAAHAGADPSHRCAGRPGRYLSAGPHARPRPCGRLQLDGRLPWYGAWGDLAAHTSRQPYHGPFVVPTLDEGAPTTKPLAEDAAHFLIRQVHAHPHAVTIYAAGPLTNIALAISIDPDFAELTRASSSWAAASPADRRPRVRHAPAPRVQLLVRSRSRAHHPSRAPGRASISPRRHLRQDPVHARRCWRRSLRRNHPQREYIAKYTGEFYYLWDELAAAAGSTRRSSRKERTLYVDVDLARGPNYGDTLTWTRGRASPQTRSCSRSTCRMDLDTARFYKLFVDLMKAPPVASRQLESEIARQRRRCRD